ncbi:MAG: T9SS type A sorting domain-containing protein [Salinibacter sp.]
MTASNLEAVFQIGDTDEEAQSRFEVSAGEVEVQQNVEIAFNADTGPDGTPADPFPVFEIDDDPSTDDDARVFGPGTVSFNVVGENQFGTNGTGTLETLFVQDSAPSFVGDGDQEGNKVTFSAIGNGGESRANSGVLRFPNLTEIEGTFTANGSSVDVTAPVLGTITTDLNVEAGAVVSVGGDADFDDKLSVKGETDVEGSSTLNANDAAEFAGVVDILGAGTLATFDGQATFNSTLNVEENGDPSNPATATFNNVASFQDVNLGSTLNFNAPGLADVIGRSTINGTLTADPGAGNSSTINLGDGTAAANGSGNGRHDLQLKGNANLASGTLTFNLEDNETDIIQNNGSNEPTIVPATPEYNERDVGTNLILSGSSKQEFVGGSGDINGADRLVLDNSSGVELTIAENNSAFDLEVLDILRLEDGDFVTNGGLDMRQGESGTVAAAPEENNVTDSDLKRTLVRKIDNTGNLIEGVSSQVIDGEDVAYRVESSTAQTPYRIKYIGSGNTTTGAEFLPDGVSIENRTLPELEVAMSGDDNAITLSPPAYRIASPRTGRQARTADSDARLEILGGDLVFTQREQLRLECRGTIQRGSRGGAPAEFITGDVVEPIEALTLGFNCTGSNSFAGGTDFVKGIEGVNLQYTNTAAIDGASQPGTSRGIEWLSRSQQQQADNRRPEEILDVHVAGTGAVQLASGSTYQFNQNMRIEDGSTLDLSADDASANTLRMQTFNEAPGQNVGGIVEDVQLNETGLDGANELAPGNTLRFVGSGGFDVQESDSLHFRGAGQATVLADANDTGNRIEKTLPNTLIRKMPAESGASRLDVADGGNDGNVRDGFAAENGGDRRVVFATANTNTIEDNGTTTVDGYVYEGDFVIVNAQHFGEGPTPDASGDKDGDEISPAEYQDGVTLAGRNTGIVDGVGEATDRVDVFEVQGNFVQGTGSDAAAYANAPGASVLGFEWLPGIDRSGSMPDSRFVVTGSFTKNATDSTRFYVGGVSTDPLASVAQFSIGQVDAQVDSLTQENGSFYAIVSESFVVKGGVRNSSPVDELATDTTQSPGGPSAVSFSSPAFEVSGFRDRDEGEGGIGPEDAFASITGDVIQRAGTMLFEQFAGNNSLIEIGSATRVDAPTRPSDFMQDVSTPWPLDPAPNTNIPTATTVNVQDSVNVRGGAFRGNLNFPLQGLSGSTPFVTNIVTDGNGNVVSADTVNVNYRPEVFAPRDQAFRAAAINVGNATQDLSPTMAQSVGNAPEAFFDVSAADFFLENKLVPRKEIAESIPGALGPDSVASPSNPTLDRRVVVGGENTGSYETEGTTTIQEDAQLRLDGYEWSQRTGGLAFFGDGDIPGNLLDFNVLEAALSGVVSTEPIVNTTPLRQREDLSFQDEYPLDVYGFGETSNRGLVGTFRFEGDDLQTVETDESPGTYFHGLVVSAEEDGDGIQLASDVSTNTLRGGQGVFPEGTISTTAGARSKTDGSEHGVQRPFGTLVLQEGNVRTQSDTLNVLAPVPTSGNDLVEANNADEFRDGNAVPASPVLGGDNDSKVVGNLRRAIEDPGTDTGGFVEDGYIFPMGTVGEEPRYRGFVLETVTDHSDAQFYTVSTISDPGISLPDGLTDPGVVNGSTVDLDLNVQSLPYFRVTYDQAEGFNTFDVRVLSNVEGVSDVNQLRILQASEGANEWNNAVAGGEDGYAENEGSPIDDESGASGGPNATISGVSNVIHEGVDLRKGTIFGLASDSEYNGLGTGERIAGKATYHVTGRGIAGAQVAVYTQTDTVVTSTDSDGNFVATGLNPGTNYNVRVVGIQGTVDSSEIDAVDALQTLRIANQSLTPAVPLQATIADVTVDNTVGAVDALRIARFDAGQSVTLGPAGTSFASNEATVGSSSGNEASVQAAAYGDVDGSSGYSTSSSTASPIAVAPPSKSAASKSGAPAESTTLPVRLSNAATVGAYSLTMEYPADKVTFKGVKSGRDVIANAQDGKIQVSWFDRSPSQPASYSAGDKLFALKFEKREGVENGTSVELGKVTGKFADQEANTLSGVTLTAPTIEVGSSPESFAFDGNYPNPVQANTNFGLQLPSQANVTVEVHNVLGQTVRTIEKDLSAGSHTLSMDASGLSSGAYVYRVTVEMGSKTIRKTGRMTVIK